MYWRAFGKITEKSNRKMREKLVRIENDKEEKREEEEVGK